MYRLSRGIFVLGVDFFLEAIQQFTGLLWSNPFDFEKFEKQLGEQQQAIILRQSLGNAEAAHNSRLQMSVFHQRVEQHLDDEVLQYAGNNERELHKVANEKSKWHLSLRPFPLIFLPGLIERVREALLERLSNYNYKPSFSEACNKRHEGTGQWFFDCPEFEAWNQAEVSCGLWVHGIRK